MKLPILQVSCSKRWKTNNSVVAPSALLVLSLLISTSSLSDDSLGFSDIALRGTSVPLVADFNTPAGIVERLADTRAVTFSQMTASPADLTRFSFGASDSTDIFVLSDTGGVVSPSLKVSTDFSEAQSATNDLLLQSMFQFREIDKDKFAIYSTKHSNYALDVDDSGTNLILRDIRSLAAYKLGGGTTFLTFSQNADSLIIIANGRYQLNLEASGAANSLQYDATDWSEKYLVLNGVNLELTSGAGTPMNLYNAPIKLGIPSDFNPDAIERVSNAEYYDTSASEADRPSRLTTDIDAAYADQISAKGTNASTLAAAQNMLNEIDAALAAQGSQTRYPKEFYLSFREGLFKRVLQSLESVDGNLGQLTVPYVYFTNGVDENGDNHPFMVVSTHGVPDSLAILGDVARPPGDGLTGRYPDQNVTRSFYMENFLIKIPMRDYGEVATVTENDLSGIRTLAGDAKTTDYDHHNYASAGSSALAIDGVVIYPAYNNRLNYAQGEAELSVRGLHSGRGLGVHYHADAHSAAIVNAEADSGLGLYNEADYVGVLHPPITGIGFDGVAAYGFYLDGDTTSHGASVALDDFNGHEHQDYGYHYHAASSNQSSKNSSYTLHELGPLGAWAGRINKVPEFQERIKRSVWLGNR